MDPRVAASSCGTTTHSLTRTQTGKGEVGGVGWWGSGWPLCLPKKPLKRRRGRNLGVMLPRRRTFLRKVVFFSSSYLGGNLLGRSKSENFSNFNEQKC